MGYPAPTIRVVLGGAMPGDIWRTGYDVECSIDPGFNQGDLDAIRAILGAKHTTWWAGVKAQNTAYVNFSTTTCYFYPTGASVATMVSEENLTPVPGTAPDANFRGYRTALCATKLTSLAGRRNKGRMFIPRTAGAVVASSGMVDSASATSLATLTAALFTDVNNDNWTVNQVSSQLVVVTSPSRPTPGAGVTDIAVDDKPDTQRRRTNKQDPTFTARFGV